MRPAARILPATSHHRDSVRRAGLRRGSENPIAGQPAVGLDLGFARPPGADSRAEPLEVGQRPPLKLPEFVLTAPVPLATLPSAGGVVGECRGMIAVRSITGTSRQPRVPVPAENQFVVTGDGFAPVRLISALTSSSLPRPVTVGSGSLRRWILANRGDAGGPGQLAEVRPGPLPVHYRRRSSSPLPGPRREGSTDSVTGFIPETRRDGGQLRAARESPYAPLRRSLRGGATGFIGGATAGHLVEQTIN